MGLRKVDTIVIHCSASPNGKFVIVDDIDAWHKERGFLRDARIAGRTYLRLRHIGYHFVIYVGGWVEIGRDIQEAGAHARGHNARSIGVCMVGTDKYCHDQWATLRGEIQKLLALYPAARVIGHRDLSPDLNKNGRIEPFEFVKTCPGFDVGAWLSGGMEPLHGHILEAAS